ncbi:hypothetical protein DPEC_G00272670 [Dallia pectoralis]|uniref:Uncharacterized protein n=1 Tax=Dallia pectoralis TaxID=75939 RepID=A0ACC2FQ37_DALPE|nr:hypothetical protein DPEC_G00272670 [Dallia pectoralis]
MSKSFLQVVIIVQTLLNGLSWAEEVTGIKGNAINISFSFQHTLKASVESVGLYKDGHKIGECSGNHEHQCSSEKDVCVFDKATKRAFFCIRNLTSVDNGTYWATMFSSSGIPPLVKSNVVTLNLQAESNATDSSSTINNTEHEASDSVEMSPRLTYPLLVVLVVLGVPCVALLVGLLTWFCWMDKKNPERDKREELSAKPQQSCEAPIPVPVYSVEYGVLSFDNRPSGLKGKQYERQKEGVEYATITFPPRQREPNRR